MAIERPTSPHLQIYRWQITMVLSILHRSTGMFLCLGALGLVAAILSIAAGAQSFQMLVNVVRHPLGQVFFFGCMFSLFFHMANGIRHLFWDIGKGFEIAQSIVSGWLVVLVSSGATAVLAYLLLTR